MRVIDGITITTYRLSFPFTLFAKGKDWKRGIKIALLNEKQVNGRVNISGWEK